MVTFCHHYEGMTPAQFIEWRIARGLTQPAAGELLGLTKRQIIRYETGTSRIPKTVALACAAIARGIIEGDSNG